MVKTLAYVSVLAGGLLACATTVNARQISVWGNTFTVDDGAAPSQPGPVAPRFGATVEQPERFMPRHRRLDSLY